MAVVLSASLSGPAAIPTYLSIVKDEAAKVAQFVKSTPAVQRTAAAFQSDSVHISSPADLLLAANQSSLQVVLGAYNMSGQSTETGLLKQLLTQDPTASNSLVRKLGSPDDLDFVKAMTGRTTISMDFGDPAASSFTAGGSSASEVSVSNLAWTSPDTSLSSASPAKSWSYVLDDGTGEASIAAALTTALQATGTSTDPVTASYSVADGSIVPSDGAPQISTSVDSEGNTTYSLTLATDDTGAATRVASVVAVKVPAATSTPTLLSANSALPLLSSALAATGFNVVSGPGSSLSIINPINNGTLSLSPASYSSFAAVTPEAIGTGDTVLRLGSAGLGLSAGQVLLSGSNSIGTVKSVDAVGNVTLTAASASIVAANSTISVAIGAGVAHVGTEITAADAAPAGSTTLALGLAATGLKAGQIITDGTGVVGIVKSVDASGNVKLMAALQTKVASGDILGVLPQVSDKTTPALSDAGNVKTILSQYETGQYEAAEGEQVGGLDDALYFTRTMPTITSINQLMSDPALLKVITTDLGVSATFGSLPFDQQQHLLTSKITLSSFSNPATVQKYAEQYLALTGEQAASGGGTDPALALLAGNTQASDTAASDGGAGLYSALYPSGGNSASGLTGILAALYA